MMEIFKLNMKRAPCLGVYEDKTYWQYPNLSYSDVWTSYHNIVLELP